jgi:hypothetical protein
MKKLIAEAREKRRWSPYILEEFIRTVHFILLLLATLVFYSSQRNINVKGKVHPITGHQGPRGIVLLILDLGARRG